MKNQLIYFSAFIFVTCAPLSFACECMEITPEMSQKNYNKAQYIIKGKVVSTKHYGNKNPSMPLIRDYDVAEIKVLKIYKGKPGDIIPVLYFPHPKSCGTYLEVGMDANLLVFTDKSNRLFLNGMCVDLTQAHWDKLKINSLKKKPTNSRFHDLDIRKGMRRSDVEQQIAKALGKTNSYSVYGNNLMGGKVEYRDGEWILEVVYNAGAPAPTDINKDGIHEHLPPIDETVYSYAIKLNSTFNEN